MKYSCCIEMLFTEHPFIERIHRAKQAGFDCVEFWCWTNKDIPAIRAALDETGLEVGVFQGNIEGRMIDERDQDLYVEGVLRSVKTARTLGCRTLFLMSDLMKPNRSVLEADRPISPEEKRRATIAVLRRLIPVAEANGITFVIEPLNTKVDHMGYSLNHSLPGAEIIREVGHPLIRLLYDAYHMQIMEGNLIETIRALSDTFGYFHIADVPGRNQPGTGEINYRNVLRALRETGYEGKVGFEFEPRGVDSTRAVAETFALI